MPERGIDCMGFAVCCRTSSFAIPFSLGGCVRMVSASCGSDFAPLAVGIWLESIHIYSPDDWND